MSDVEITALVLAEHEIFRREFAALDDLAGQELATAWEALHARLEVHAVAEEQSFYPLLPQEAVGEQETAEGVHDHNRRGRGGGRGGRDRGARRRAVPLGNVHGRRTEAAGEGQATSVRAPAR